LDFQISAEINRQAGQAGKPSKAGQAVKPPAANAQNFDVFFA